MLIPKLTWCAGVAGYDLETLRALRYDVVASCVDLELFELASTSMVWVPSHNKESVKFRPPEWCHPGRLRRLNDRADVAAKRAVAARQARSSRPAWIASVAAAKQWEMQTLQAVARIAEAYARHAQGLK